jgi:cupin fold WbuC family metalloprotein
MNEQDPASVLRLLTDDLLTEVAQKAAGRSRLRQNYDFHGPAEKVQRFINAFQPGTYVRPHRHLRDPEVNGFEFFLVLQGSLGMLLFNSQGKIIHRERLDASGPNRGIELAEGVYHSLVALAADTVILELKEGPYIPATDKEFLQQFPQEGAAEAEELVSIWSKSFS